MTLDLFGEQNELAEAITALGKPVLKKNMIKKGATVKVSVEVKNAGKIPGDEIVQMYIRDVVSSVTRPVKELIMTGPSSNDADLQKTELTVK